MNRSKILTPFLCFQLLQPSFAQTDLEISVQRSIIDLKTITSFVEQARPCYESLGPSEYRKVFCENNKDHLFNFDSLTLELAKLKDQNFSKWLEQLNKEKPDEKFKEGLKLADLFYQDCLAYEIPAEGSSFEIPDHQNDFDSGEYGEEEAKELVKEEASVPSSKLDILKELFPVDRNGDLSLDLRDFNRMILRWETYATEFDDKGSKELVEKIRKEGMELRREILKDNPLLLNYTLANNPHYGEPVEVVYRLFQEQTGIGPKEISAETKHFYENYRHYHKAISALKEQGYRNPQDFFDTTPPEFVIVRDEQQKSFILNKDFSDAQSKDLPPAFTPEMLYEQLGWKGEDAVSLITLAISTNQPLNQSHPSIGKIESTVDKFSERIKKWNDDIELMLEKYDETFSNEKSNTEQSFFDDEQEGSFCEMQRQSVLREFSDEDMIVSFYADKNNRQFMTDQFEQTRKLMREAVETIHLSESSRQGMMKILDDVKFNLPELNNQVHSEVQKNKREIIELLMREGVRRDPYSALDEASNYLEFDDRYRNYFQLENFGSANAFYHPHSEGHVSHSVTASCGIALPTVQQHYPEFFMGIMAHELGHALDASYSGPNRAQYSKESLEVMDDLRDCLIKNNQGLHHRISEDFADHMEAIFMAHWMKTTKDDPRWPLRRQKYLHFSYSNLCEDNGLKMSTHSDNEYRARHILSHPYIADEFSEMNMPEIPFCRHLLAPHSLGGSR